MNLRFHPILLFALLVLMSACSTTGSRPPGDSFPGQDLPVKAETTAAEIHDPLEPIGRDPSERSLEEVIALSNSLIGYQPELVLEIVRSLESVPSGQLLSMIDRQRYDPEFTEWLELALQARTVMINGSAVTTAAQNWALYHYGHVVTRSGFARLVSDYKNQFPAPSQVAILLPADGGLAAAGNAIRDGILSAYLDQPGESTIRFYSSGDNSESAVSAYLQARQDGASQIVGPLRIESTRTLAGIDEIDIPVLLLNEPGRNEVPDGDPVTFVNSLSLSQAEEAEAIANRAISQGQKQAIVVVPDNAWGTRIENAFTAVFEDNDGKIAATARFSPSSSDHSDMLTQVLRIDESNQRKADLQFRLGGIALDFEPIRRDDFDFIFMGTSPAEGRELKPLLRFHDAGDVPVYAMGRVFSGKVESGSDQDLNGIIFPATTWQLRAVNDPMPSLDSIRGGAFGNLHALGRDAWNLLRWLPLLQKDSDLWFPGEIGNLRMQENGSLYRSPAWAQFSAGRPVSYRWPIAFE